MHFKFTYFSFFLIHLELKQQIYSYTECSSLKNHTLIQTKIGKMYMHFQTGEVQKLYPWGSTYSYDLIRGYPPSPGPPRKYTLSNDFVAD